MEAFEAKGTWWLPQHPEPQHQVPGILKFDPVEGATLDVLGDSLIAPIVETYGTLELGNMRIALDNVVIDTICGFMDGRPTTLYKCRQTGLDLAVGYQGTRFLVQAVFIGCHCESDEDAVFDSISINYTDLEQWLGVTGFTGGFKLTQAGRFVEGKYDYLPPAEISYKFDDISIVFRHELEVVGDFFVDVHTKQKTFIEIKPDIPMHYGDYHRGPIYHIRNLLTLGTGNAVLPLIVKGRKNECVKEVKGEIFPQDIYILYAAKGSHVSQRKIARWDMLFRYTEVADGFPTYLKNWFSKAEKLRHVFDLYFGILYVPSMYSHLEFLTLAQALEAYHRHMYGGTYISKEEYEPVRKALVDAIPTELEQSHRDSLKKRIEFGYEYSLRKRINLILVEVLKPYEGIVERLIGTKDKRAQFISDLVDMRNDLTHYPKETEPGIISEYSKQRELIHKMRLLMQLCFLAEMEIPGNVVDKLVANNADFQNWLH